ncbi:dTDP-4-dehydrorhamnose reductase [Muribaculum sp.]|jgi:dTDP-4-dehydrorhamnose reductase|uniref:dTDP-4-dehydrorhamnose reductase n=1 Tax=Muribaculum sp. TaxID=1918611 RepID=UPI00257BA2A4|nr:dTDP-4-dehydrorhamnose reductase [Muribaculum sp.]
MKILITGCNGQLGLEMRNVLERIVPGNTIYTDVELLDLTDSKAVDLFVAKHEFTHIVNCAAYTNVEKAEEEKALCTQINVEAVKNLANAASKTGTKIVHVSTDYVFDGNANRPYCESDKVNPISQYGTSKRLGETALIALAPESIIVRTAWLYSPHGHNFVKTMLSLAKKNIPLSVVTDQVGTPTYALDLAEAIAKIVTARQWVPGIYHFTNSGVASWFDFAKAVFRLSGNGAVSVSPIPAADYPTVAKRPYYSVLDTRRIRATYAVETPYWEDSLAHCLNRIVDIK